MNCAASIAGPSFCQVVFAHARAEVLEARKRRPVVATMGPGLLLDPDGVSVGSAILGSLARQAPHTKVIVAASDGDRAHAPAEDLSSDAGLGEG